MFQHILNFIFLIPNKIICNQFENNAYNKFEKIMGFSLDVFPNVRVYNVHQGIISLLIDVFTWMFFSIMILVRLSFDDKYPY